MSCKLSKMQLGSILSVLSSVITSVMIDLQFVFWAPHQSSTSIRMVKCAMCRIQKNEQINNISATAYYKFQSWRIKQINNFDY